MTIPSIPKDLVAFLDRLYSAQNSLPVESDSDRAIWTKVGKRELVVQLIQWRKDQETGADEEGFPHVLVSAAGSSGPGDQHAHDPRIAGPAGPGSSGSFASPADRIRRFTE